MLRSLLILAGSALLCGAAAGMQSTAATARIRITSSPNTQVRLVAPVAVAMKLVGTRGTVRGDTILVRTPARLEASLATSDLWIESEGGVPITVEAEFADAPERRLGGSGHTLVLKAGGREIRVPR